MKTRHLLAGLTGIVAGAVAVKLLTRPRDAEWPGSLNFIYYPEHSWFTTVDGVRVHYQEAGEENAPVMILIHGFISSTMVWNEVFLPLARAGFRVIALDLPGYGYSEKPRDAAYTIEGQARAVVGLMDRLEIDKAIVTGASYGGAIAATIALDNPERVERLILIGAVTNDDAKNHALLRIARTPVVGDLLTPLFLGSRWAMRKRMERVYRRLGRPFDERKLAARHHVLAVANAHRAVIRSARRWNANRIQRDAHLIGQPTLIAWGDHDQEIPIMNGYRLRDEIPNARMVIFKDCGHLPPQEYPQQFVEAVSEFCKLEPGRDENRSEPPAAAGV